MYHRTGSMGDTTGILTRRDYLKKVGVSLAGLVGLGFAGSSCSKSQGAPAQAGSGPYLNVKDFGARGDGVADDTEAVQEAIESVPDRGGTLFFPSGAYRITSSLTVRNPGIRLLGEGPVSHNESLNGAGGRGSMMIADGDGMTLLCIGHGLTEVDQSGPSIEHMNFADRTDGTATLLRIRLSNHWNVHVCSFRDADVGLLVDSDQIVHGGSTEGGDASWGMVHQCHFNNNSKGIHVPYSGGLMVNGGSFINDPDREQVAIRQGGGSQLRVLGIKVDNGVGVWTEGNGGVIQGSQFEDCNPAVRLDGNAYSSNGRYNKVIGCHFSDESTIVGVEVTSRAIECKIALNTFSNIGPENRIRDYGTDTQVL